jgi:formylmethanofuran dehydrogenase subunit B
VSRRQDPRGQAPRAGAAPRDETPAQSAARLLRAGRRVLVTGLADCTLEAIALACDVAEALGAAIDAGAADAASPLGPVVARAGGITADPGDLRDRADLVIAWFCDPGTLPAGSDRPSFGATWLEPPLPGERPRRLVAVGPEPWAAGCRHLPVPAEAAVDAARLLHALLLGHEVPPENAAAAAVADACGELTAAIRLATCVGVLTSRSGESDPLGLADWAVRLVVRQIAHERPAFMVPLPPVPGGGFANAAAADAVLTWRYGAAGAIARADRWGGDFRPAECSAAALIARGEVDRVLAVGRLSAEIEAAIAARAADLAVVRIDDREAPPAAAASDWLAALLAALRGPSGKEAGP